MSSKYVVGPDGHVMSADEQEQATRLDPPDSTEGAPDTHAAYLAAVTIERCQRMIRSYEKRLMEDEAELPTLPPSDDDWLRKMIEENITMSRHRIAELQAEIRQAQGISK